MARPDDNHEPRAILGDDGEVLAIAHVSPDASPETMAHLREVVEAARRLQDQMPAEERDAIAERQQAAIARIRARAHGVPDGRKAAEEALAVGLDAALADTRPRCPACRRPVKSAVDHTQGDGPTVARQYRPCGCTRIVPVGGDR